MAAGRRPTLSRAGLLLVVAALLGLAASLLLEAPSSTGYRLFPSTSGPSLPHWAGLAILVLLVAIILLPLVMTRLSSSKFLPSSIWSVAIVVLLVAVGFYFVIHTFAPAASPATNATNGSAPLNSTMCHVNCSPATGSVNNTTLVAPPSYEGYLLIGLILAAVVVAVYVVPPMVAGRSRPEGPEEGPSAGPSDLQAALDLLRAASPEEDARSRIIRAYGELLGRVSKGLPRLEYSTPREIEAELVRVYRIRASTAHEMTALFEEARYSRGRELGPEAVARAERALESAKAEMVEPGVLRR